MESKLLSADRSDNRFRKTPVSNRYPPGSLPGAKSLYAPLRPGIWQRRQKTDVIQVTLDQHFGDSRRSPEVAVDLERRVIVEQIGERRLPQQFLKMNIGLFAVQQPRPEVDDPGPAPAGMSPP